MTSTGGRSERGSATVELAIMTPAVVMLLLLAVAAGRIVQAKNDVYGSAADAARAASLRQAAGGADADARDTAARALASRGVSCRRLSVTTDGVGGAPGSTLSVEVSCAVGLDDLGLIGVPGSRTVSARAYEVVDRFRGS